MCLRLAARKLEPDEDYTNLEAIEKIDIFRSSGNN